MTEWIGDIVAYRRADGVVRLEVRPGPLRITQAVVEQAEPEWLSRAGDLLTFHSLEDDGSRQAYRYRIIGLDASGPDGGWLLAQPAGEMAHDRA